MALTRPADNVQPSLRARATALAKGVAGVGVRTAAEASVYGAAVGIACAATGFPVEASSAAVGTGILGAVFSLPAQAVTAVGRRLAGSERLWAPLTSAALGALYGMSLVGPEPVGMGVAAAVGLAGGAARGYAGSKFDAFVR